MDRLAVDEQLLSDNLNPSVRRRCGRSSGSRRSRAGGRCIWLDALAQHVRCPGNGLIAGLCVLLLATFRLLLRCCHAHVPKALTVPVTTAVVRGGEHQGHAVGTSDTIVDVRPSVERAATCLCGWWCCGGCAHRRSCSCRRSRAGGRCIWLDALAQHVRCPGNGLITGLCVLLLAAFRLLLRCCHAHVPKALAVLVTTAVVRRGEHQGHAVCTGDAIVHIRPPAERAAARAFWWRSRAGGRCIWLDALAQHVRCPGNGLIAGLCVLLLATFRLLLRCCHAHVPKALTVPVTTAVVRGGEHQGHAVGTSDTIVDVRPSVERAATSIADCLSFSKLRSPAGTRFHIIFQLQPRQTLVRTSSFLRPTAFLCRYICCHGSHGCAEAQQSQERHG